MALVLGTNAGFVTVAPTTDPNGTNSLNIDGASFVTKHTSPANSAKITEIGWYRNSNTNTANFEIALYADSAGVAGSRLFVDATNSSAVTGWITVAVDWAISANTAYWLGVQMDAHGGSSGIDIEASGGSGYDSISGATTLNDPYGGGAVQDADGIVAIYALVELDKTVNVSDSITIRDFIVSVDEYSESNSGSSFDVYSGVPEAGQTFTGNGAVLDSVKLFIRKSGSPTGNATAKIYATTGTFGTNSVPTGSVLATSGTLDVATLTTSLALNTFTFTGADRIDLTDTSKFAVSLAYSGGDVSNKVVLGADLSSPTHSGNSYQFASGVYSSNSRDVNFYVYGLKSPVIETPIGGDLSINKSDTITVTESVTMFTDQLYRSVSDNITITESIGRLVESYVNKSENITITENKVVDIPITKAVSDSVTVTENTKVELESNRSVSDSITITENRSLLIPELLINKSENITITESIGKDLTVAVNKSESITVTENADPELLSFISKSDSVTVTENIARLLESYVNKSESITVTENAVVSIDAGAVDLQIAVSDSVTVTENKSVQFGMQVSVSDSINISEAITTLIAEHIINKSDSVTVSESVNRLMESYVSKSDTVTITENSSVHIPQLLVGVSDSASINESVNVVIANLNVSVSDSITLSENLELAGLPVITIPYRLLRGPRGTMLGPRQFNFTLPRRGPRQTRPPRSY